MPTRPERWCYFQDEWASELLVWSSALLQLTVSVYFISKQVFNHLRETDTTSILTDSQQIALQSPFTSTGTSAENSSTASVLDALTAESAPEPLAAARHLPLPPAVATQACAQVVDGRCQWQCSPPQDSLLIRLRGWGDLHWSRSKGCVLIVTLGIIKRTEKKNRRGNAQ
ncbi:hypothetical protein QQF64_009356 [Cirrhinus molitorella]|uniref:Uncharacterized protein n=1 Tax=Cirrhinus molitorella TaxID=172907 RepID=A0ABR3M4C4_9TELE